MSADDATWPIIKRLFKEHARAYAARYALAFVFMAHAPGAIRFYHRQLLHALVLQALE